MDLISSLRYAAQKKKEEEEAARKAEAGGTAAEAEDKSVGDEAPAPAEKPTTES